MLLIRFLCSDSLGLFTWNISCGKNIVHRGVTKVGQSIFFSVVFGKTLIADSTKLINKSFYFWKQISDKMRSIRAQNHLIVNMRLPITAPFGKTRDMFLYFLYYVQHVELIFFSYFQRGHKYFSIRNRLKMTEKR